MCDNASGGNKQENRENLTRLLLRLDPDTTRAWERYGDIRLRLAKYFEWNHCTGPEDLADEVLDRIAAKPDSDEIREVETYSFGVARLVCLESYKRTQRETHSEDLPGGENGLADVHDHSAEIVDRLYQERRLTCLRQCLARLTLPDRDLVIRYYSAQEEKQKTFRRGLAKETGLNPGALRVRTNRLRAQLEQCVKHCLDARRRGPNPGS